MHNPTNAKRKADLSPAAIAIAAATASHNIHGGRSQGSSEPNPNGGNLSATSGLGPTNNLAYYHNNLHLPELTCLRGGTLKEYCDLLKIHFDCFRSDLFSDKTLDDIRPANPGPQHFRRWLCYTAYKASLQHPGSAGMVFAEEGPYPQFLIGAFNLSTPSSQEESWGVKTWGSEVQMLWDMDNAGYGIRHISLPNIKVIMDLKM